MAQLESPHHFNRPNYPQGNGQIERSFRTDEDEFYQVEELPADFGGLQTALLAWDVVYEQVQPNQRRLATRHRKGYGEWMDKHHVGREVLSDIY